MCVAQLVCVRTRSVLNSGQGKLQADKNNREFQSQCSGLVCACLHIVEQGTTVPGKFANDLVDICLGAVDVRLPTVVPVSLACRFCCRLDESCWPMLW